MNHLEIRNFGPIRRADVRFGDLTLLVGPQATGKSLFAQLFKAIEDAGAIRAELRSHGYDWLHGTNPTADYCSLYFGGGLQSLVGKRTLLRADGRSIDFSRQVVRLSSSGPGDGSVFRGTEAGSARPDRPAGRASKDESVFLIPAQRVLVLQRGWPQPFMSYSVVDPYSVRHFSDTLRLLMEQGLGVGAAIFPGGRQLKAGLKRVVDDSIYLGATVELQTDELQKRFVLTPPGSDALPYATWSAGQREFTPLLLGLYWLLPAGRIPRRAKIRTVIIEEPEMGLHPQAIVGFCLLVLELLTRGYRAIVSTHSPVVLDVVWAIQQLRELPPKRAVTALGNAFGVAPLPAQLRQLLTASLRKEYKTYYFERTPKGVATRDISSLDPGADDQAVSGWGGLSGFSGRIAESVGAALIANRG